MYPQTNTLSQLPSYGEGMQGAQAPQPSGVASRIQELQKTIAETESLTYQLRAALGISSPENAKQPTPPATLAEVLYDSRIRLDRANNDLQEVIGHLNS